MIVFYNPRSTTPGKQPLPLSLLSLAAVIDGREPWVLVDGNLTDDPASDILMHLERHPAALLAVTVMPGPQLSQAVPVCQRVKAARPRTPIVWGGYFPSQHADVVLAAPYVDFVVRSQGEGPFVELIDGVVQARLALAHELLAAGKTRTVSEAAFACGFNNLSHFTRRFSERYGELPVNLLKLGQTRN